MVSAADVRTLISAADVFQTRQSTTLADTNVISTADNKKSMCPIPEKLNFKETNEDDATRRNNA